MNPKDLTALVEKVCGSDGLRSQYEELEARKHAAEERAAFQHTRKKNLLAEKRQKKEQRDEAEKHQKLVEELVRGGWVLIRTPCAHTANVTYRSASSASSTCFKCFTLSRTCSVPRLWQTNTYACARA